MTVPVPECAQVNAYINTMHMFQRPGAGAGYGGQGRLRALSSLRLALPLLSLLIIGRSFAVVQPGKGEAFTCKRLKPRASRLSFVMTHGSGEGSHHISDLIRSLKCVRLDQEETFDIRYLKKKKGFRNQTSSQLQMMLLNRLFNADAAAFPRSKVLFSHPAFESSPNASDHIAMTASKRWDWGQYGRPPKNMTWSDWADRVDGSFAACACEIRGALVRLAARDVCKLQVMPVVLARTNLLRYSLSNCTATSTPFLTP